MSKNIPPLSNGLRYGIGPNDERICLGAQMGRQNKLSIDYAASPKLHLRRLRFVDQCYDEGGAYWGAPADIWRATCGDEVEIFVRATSRSIAKAKILSLLPNATFYR